MKMKLLKSGLATGAALLCAAAAADNTGITPIQNGPTVTFSGFGTIGVVQTNTNDGTYTTGEEAFGATKTIDFGPDTKAGIQMDTKFNDTFSATVQVFSKQNAVGSYSPDVEWAFGKVKLGDGFDLRLGRIGAPFFMTSDFRNVGYTNISIRTPVDVYGLVPVRSFDGGDLLYRIDFGDITLNSQLWVGKSTTRIGQNAQGDEDIVLNNIAGINFSVEDGPLTLRYGSMKTRLATAGTGLEGFDTLLKTLSQVGQAPGLGELTTIGNEMSINDKFASFSGVGAVLDLGGFVANAEYVKRKTDSVYVPSINAWYTTLGYRLGDFTPYVSYSERSTTSTTSYASPAVSPLLPPQIQGAVPVLIGTVNTLIGKSDEKSTAIGVRWDAGKNYDIKAEFQQIKVPAGSSGVFSYITDPGGVYAVDTKVNLFSLAVDFVF
jgi:hypothetical protein